jgi:hypothetical protein
MSQESVMTPPVAPAARAFWSHPERQALAYWALTRLAGLWVAAQATWLVGDGAHVPPFLERWNQWDARRFVEIAEFGYDGPPGGPGQYEAFFPGMPLMLKVMHLAIPQWQLDGLLISLVAGAVAVTALARIATDEFGDAVGRKAVVALIVSPMAVFLLAGYSDALFLGFALPAWLQARRGHWGRSGLLAAGATATRISGLYLIAALVVEFATAWWAGRRPGEHRPPRPRLLQAGWLVVSLLPVAAFFGYLKHRTGRWDYYFEAERIGWGRQYVGLGKTFEAVLQTASGPEGSYASWAFGYRVEMAAMATGVLLTVYLLWRRRWSEACLVSLPVVSLAPMASYSTAARSTLAWWPLWITLALAANHPRWGRRLTWLYLAVSVPLSVLLLAAFTTGRWAG